MKPNEREFDELLELVYQMLGGRSQVPADFDAQAWLSQWLEREQPALGGRAPRELLASEEGFGSVKRLLGALSSGAFQ